MSKYFQTGQPTYYKYNLTFIKIEKCGVIFLFVKEQNISSMKSSYSLNLITFRLIYFDLNYFLRKKSNFCLVYTTIDGYNFALKNEIERKNV